VGHGSKSLARLDGNQAVQGDSNSDCNSRLLIAASISDPNNLCVLTDVTQGGDPLAGSFTVDESTFTLSAVDIFSSHYDVTFNLPVSVGASAITVGNSSGQDLLLTFYDNLANSPDVIYPYNDNYYSDGLSGPDIFSAFVFGDVDPTPLPAALPLFITGLVGLGLLGWRRKRKNTTAIAAV
jgi:hypothetical protein